MSVMLSSRLVRTLSLWSILVWYTFYLSFPCSVLASPAPPSAFTGTLSDVLSALRLRRLPLTVQWKRSGIPPTKATVFGQKLTHSAVWDHKSGLSWTRKRDSLDILSVRNLKRIVQNLIVQWSSSDIWKQTAIQTLQLALSYTFFVVTLKKSIQIVSSNWGNLMSKFELTDDNIKKFRNNSKYLHPNVTIDKYEEEILCNVIDPQSIKEEMDDIGGLDDVKRSLMSALIHTNRTVAWRNGRQPISPTNPLLDPVKSVALHGPPGCGKLFDSTATKLM